MLCPLEKQSSIRQVLECSCFSHGGAARRHPRFRLFRDRLSSDAGLLAAYCEVKRRIISDGVTDTDEYAVRKRQIVHQILGADHQLKKQPNKSVDETFSRLSSFGE